MKHPYRQRWQAHGQRKNAADRPDGWLGELTLPPERKADESRADASRTGRRASDLGILPVSLEDYARLLTSPKQPLVMPWGAPTPWPPWPSAWSCST